MDTAMDNHFTDEEREQRKKAIFDAMGKRGQQRILRMGYENWDPFQEPKDPREAIRSGSAIRASMIVHQFYETSIDDERMRAYHKELVDLCVGLLRNDPKAKALSAFSRWFANRDPEK